MSTLEAVIAYSVGDAIGLVIAIAYFTVYRTWRARRIERRWQATYARRCATAHAPAVGPWERKQEVAQRIADAKVRMGL